MPTIPAHPLGVLPMGAALSPAAAPSSRAAGLGAFHALADDVLLTVVLPWLGLAELSALQTSSGAGLAFCSSEALYKAHHVSACAELTSWRGASWKLRRAGPLPGAVGVTVRGVYSDVLHHTWRVRNFALPAAALRETVERRCGRVGDPARLSVEDFRATYDRPGVPVVLTGACAHWPAASRWTARHLAQSEGRFLAGGYEWSMAAFLAYARGNNDDVPLYLFDKGIAGRAQLTRDYDVPDYFADDLFSTLPAGARPDNKWLLVGGPRSGSPLHTDPNGVSAWSATVSGKKKWVFFPPSVEAPPGVVPSADGSDLVAPLSVAEWFDAFYADAAKHPLVQECTTRPGDVVFVPRMWWHMVINCDDEDSEGEAADGAGAGLVVSVSHNFCSPAGLREVLKTLKEKPQCVAGTSGSDGADEAGGLDVEARRKLEGLRFREKVVATLAKNRPEELHAALEAEKASRGAWEALKDGEEAGGEGGGGGGGFSFGFALGGE